jgi:hypothetical protein
MVRAARKSKKSGKKENGGRGEGPWWRKIYKLHYRGNSHRELCNERGGGMETTNVARFVDHADPKRYHRE